MRSLFLSLISIFLISGIASAQSPLEAGGIQLNAGVGFSGWGLPIYVGADFGATDDISIGGEFSYRNYRNKIIGTTYNHRVMGILINGNYHFNTVLEIPDPFDFYAGLSLGYYVWTSDAKYPGNSDDGIGLGIQIGGRYYFTDKVGVNLEIGGGSTVSGGKLGLTIKL